MSFQQYNEIETVEVQQPEVRKTYKKVWDNDSQSWKTVSLYRIRRRMEAEHWLKEHYGEAFYAGPLGWYPTFDSLVLGEKIYLHYCLAKPE